MERFPTSFPYYIAHQVADTRMDRAKPGKDFSTSNWYCERGAVNPLLSAGDTTSGGNFEHVAKGASKPKMGFLQKERGKQVATLDPCQRRFFRIFSGSVVPGHSHHHRWKPLPRGTLLIDGARTPVHDITAVSRQSYLRSTGFPPYKPIGCAPNSSTPHSSR